jgi:hypothetical protein
MSDQTFLETYTRLSVIGACDRTGGIEYLRVRREWIDAGQPDDREAFIRRRASDRPPGARRRDEPVVYTGDVVRHVNSGSIGIVLEIGRTHRDGSTAEDDLAGQARRAAHRSLQIRRDGGWFPEKLWEKMFWRLTNRRRLLPQGGYVSFPLGRDHWDVAALDCLERRDRSARYWISRSPTPPGVVVQASIASMPESSAADENTMRIKAESDRRMAEDRRIKEEIDRGLPLVDDDRLSEFIFSQHSEITTPERAMAMELREYRRLYGRLATTRLFAVPR